jgi:ribosomal protein S17
MDRGTTGNAALLNNREFIEIDKIETENKRMASGYNLYGKVIRFTEKYSAKHRFKSGDVVELIDLKDLSSIENINWISREKTNPKIGDLFSVSIVSDNYIALNELTFLHPIKRFEKII